MAKKKLMKKYGWYKHSEDGGIMKAFYFENDAFMFINYNTVRTSACLVLNGYIGYNLFYRIRFGLRVRGFPR